MATFAFSRYMHCDLDDLAQRLEKDYYDSVEVMCANAGSQAGLLKDEEEHPSTALYADQCNRIIDDVKEMMRMRKSVLLPYIADLKVKKDEGHDCRNCSGKCHVEHNAYLVNLRLANTEVKEVLNKLHEEALPLYDGVVYPRAYAVLRNEMSVLDTALTELFYLEESSLIPKVLEAQRSIHA